MDSVALHVIFWSGLELIRMILRGDVLGIE